MDTNKITASLVTYNNNISDIDKLIKSIDESSVLINLIVFDNSTNNSIQKYFENTNHTFIKSKKNIGFGKGHNQCFKIAIEKKSNYHLIINPDIEFSRKTIELIIKRFELDNSISAIMPKIIYPNKDIQNLCKLIPTPYDLILRRFVRRDSKLHSKIYELKFMPEDIEFEPPMISGCFLAVKTKNLISVSGFDERYFMYLEDVDLIRKLSETGKLLYYPKAQVTHKYEKGSYKSLKLLFIHIISAIKYFNKWGWIIDNNRKKINKEFLTKNKIYHERIQ